MIWPRRVSLRPGSIIKDTVGRRGSYRPPQQRLYNGHQGDRRLQPQGHRIAATNAHAALDYAYELLGVKTPSELIQLSTAHAREQFEAMAAQTKELTELAQKVTTEIAPMSGVTVTPNRIRPPDLTVAVVV